MSEALRYFHVPYALASMDNQKLVLKLDHYLMTKMCRTSSEGLEVQPLLATIDDVDEKFCFD